MILSAEDMALLLEALNDRESVLGAEYEAARRANSVALQKQLSGKLNAVRDMAYRLQAEARCLDLCQAFDALDRAGMAPTWVGGEYVVANVPGPRIVRSAAQARSLIAARN